MRLMRNANASGKCKYAIVRLDKMPGDHVPSTREIAEAITADPSLIEHATPGSENEFFAIKLKDLHSIDALIAYARNAMNMDAEYAHDVMELASRSGVYHPFCKAPD